MAKIGRDVLPGRNALRFRKTERKKNKEVDPWLKEYEEKEKEAAARAISRMARQIPRPPDLLAPYLTSFVRMLYEDKFQFKEPISFNEVPECIPTKLLLPFNEQVVLPIFPKKSRRKFVGKHGLTPEEIVYLYKNKRVLPILMGYPTNLTKEEKNCLNVLLESKLPTLVRIDSFLDFSSDFKLYDYLMQARRHVKDVRESIMKSLRKGIIPKRVMEKEIEEIGDQLSLYYSHLCSLGLDDLANHIVSNYNLVSATLLLDTYDMFTVMPNTVGLGAMLQIDEEIELNRRIPSLFKDKLPKISNARDLVFPVEIGEFLTDYYDLVFPVDPSMEIVDKIYRDKALSKARVLLNEFNMMVRESKGDKAVEKEKDLKDIFAEAREALLALDKRVEKCRWRLNTVAYGAIGFLSLQVQAPWAGLLTGLAYRVLEKKVTNWASPKLAGVRFNPLSAAIWKFEKEFENIKKLQSELRKIRDRKKHEIKSSL